MCNPLAIIAGNPLAAISAGASVVGGIQQKQAADRAAAAALAAGEFNATIIERDISLLERQREFVNKQFAVDSERAKQAFERDIIGGARSAQAFTGFELEMGTNLATLRESAREFDFAQATAAFNNSVTNLQISDAQEEARLNAQLSRMEGGTAAASARASGTASLISGFGQGAQTAYKTNLFG